jgi:CheY-like chemotaxis protein
MDIRNAKILIVEDELEKREFLFRVLTSSLIPGTQIKRASNKKTAIENIKEFEPNIILLDISIPNEEAGVADPENVSDVLDRIRLFNFENSEKIRTIIISGTVKQKVIQELISTLNRQIVFDFIDKIELSDDIQKFKLKLITTIQKALNTEFEAEKMDYSAIRKSEIKKLKGINMSLWDKIEKNIINEFESLTEKNTNIHARAKQIIGSCGEVVEDITTYLSNDSKRIILKSYKKFNPSIKDILYALTGRSQDPDTKIISLTGTNPLISRSSADYAQQAYRYRSEVLHSSENDIENKKIFKGKKLTREDAAVSINLIIPIIIEYIEIMNKKSK